MRTYTLFGLTVITLVLTQSIPADAQWRGRGDRGGDDRGGDERRGGDDDERRGDRGRDGGRGEGGRWGGGRGGFDPSEFWKERDTNKDGIIDPKELDERTRGWLRSDKPVKISELVSRFEQERGGGGERGRDGNNNRQEEKKPLVPGFGVESEEEAKVLGFGPSEESSEGTETKPSETTSTSSVSSTSSTGNSSGGFSAERYVEGILKQKDTDGNGVIEGDELKLPGVLPSGADADGDGKITRSELEKASGVGAKKSSNMSDGSSGRRSYRFASAHDRLDGSAKGWIVSRDKNFDGQVAMHEFSSTWSDSKIREFQKYDLNGDGIVTAAEYESR